MRTVNPFSALCLLFLTVSCGVGSDPSIINGQDGAGSPAANPNIETCRGELVDRGIGIRQDIQIGVNDFSMTEARVWGPPAANSGSAEGLVFLTGVDGGFIDPVDGIYERFAEKLSQRGVHSIFVQYREPGVLEPSVEDALAAARYLRQKGVKRMILMGWSFGGAVVTHSAVQIPEVESVIAFAPQARDTEPVSLFSRQSLLLFHSRADENVPFESSEIIYQEAPTSIKKKLVEFDEPDHFLTGMSETIDPVVDHWINQAWAGSAASLVVCD